jgi:hypothetical protein
MDLSYWKTRFNGARRVATEQAAAAAPVAAQALQAVPLAVMAPIASPFSAFAADPALR